MASSTFIPPLTCLAGINRKSSAVVRFPAVSQPSNSVWPFHSLTVEERDSVKVSPLAGILINSHLVLI